MNTKQGIGSIAMAVVVGLLFYSVVGAEQASRLDLNDATLSQLDGLPGIGPVIAKRIIQFREDNGPFKRIEDLMNVRGIGEKTFLKLRDQIMVEEPELDSGARSQEPGGGRWKWWPRGRLKISWCGGKLTLLCLKLIASRGDSRGRNFTDSPFSYVVRLFQFQRTSQ